MSGLHGIILVKRNFYPIPIFNLMLKTMKTFPLVIAFLLFNLSILFSQEDTEKNINSSIEHVTVFQNSAQIRQTAQTNLSTGRSILNIGNISPYIDPQSLQVKGYGNFTVLSVNHKSNYITNLEENEEVRELRKKMEELQLKIEDVSTAIGILKEKEAFLMANRVISGKDKNLDVESFRNLYNFYSTNLEQVRNSIVEKQRNLKKLQEELEKLQKQLNQIQAGNKLPSHQIQIVVKSAASLPARFEISYLVNAAGWYPSYDIRVDKLNAPVGMIYKANLSQNTGVDWKNVKLSFSNATPNRSGNVPELYPYTLDFSVPPPPVVMYDRKKSAQDKMELQEMPAASPAMERMARGAEVRVNQNLTSMRFDVEIPYDIPSGGEAKTIEVQRIELPAEYNFQTVPKLDQNAFLMAGIHDWEQYNLLDGDANLYFENTFVGTSYINPGMVKDTLRLSLGRDQGIVVTREKRKDYSGNKFLGNNRVETRSWEISIRNTKSEAVDIKVLDQVPVSQDKEIEVKVTELSGGKLDSLKGEVSWNLNIKPGETRKLVLSYEVKYPKDRDLRVE